MLPIFTHASRSDVRLENKFLETIRTQSYIINIPQAPTKPTPPFSALAVLVLCAALLVFQAGRVLVPRFQRATLLDYARACFDLSF